MAENSKIEWTDCTWNPVTGCTRVSAGCDHCYAATMTRRLAAIGQPKYQGLVGRGHFNGVVKTHDDELAKPLGWRKPRRVFVNSMSDLFHESVPFEFVDLVFAVMALTPWLIYQILTKRPERMAEYLEFLRGQYKRSSQVARQVNKIFSRDSDRPVNFTWPLSNVHLGVSAENQQTYNERYPHWLRMREHAAVAWWSLEPLLGAIDLAEPADDWWESANVPHWIVVGGESGPGARPMHPDWARSIRDQCQAAGVPFFFKQWGAWCLRERAVELFGANYDADNEVEMARVGKKAAGCELDGREWKEFPNVRRQNRL